MRDTCIVYTVYIYSYTPIYIYIYIWGVTIHVFVLKRFGTGRSVRYRAVHGRVPLTKLHVFIICLQLHVQPFYVMANANDKTELEDPPLPLKSPSWEQCSFLVKYCNTERHVSGVTV